MKSIFDYLASKLDEDIQSKERALCGGSLPDFAAYREMCGQIRGLRIAQSLIEDSAKRYREDGDDE